MFPPLVEHAARSFTVEQLVADKAYSTRRNLELAEGLGAEAYIPFKTNVSLKTHRTSETWERLFHYYQYRRAEFLEHYHRRSLAETTFHMIKAKFGAALRSKSEVAQINELLCKVLCHNLCVLIQSMHELGVPVEFTEGV